LERAICLVVDFKRKIGKREKATFVIGYERAAWCDSTQRSRGQEDGGQIGDVKRVGERNVAAFDAW
jgi:hypothetical protein